MASVTSKRVASKSPELKPLRAERLTGARFSRVALDDLLLTLPRQITISLGRSRRFFRLVMGGKTIKRNQTLTTLDDIREDATVELIGGEADRAPVRLEIDYRAQALDPHAAGESARSSLGYSQPPYEHHFGVTFLGIEYWGFNLVGLKPAQRNANRGPALTVRVARDCPPSKGAASGD